MHCKVYCNQLVASRRLGEHNTVDIAQMIMMQVIPRLILHSNDHDWDFLQLESMYPSTISTSCGSQHRLIP
eukprot:scaffold10739_cov308-Chaetoceros_neogracile.AAC.1